MKKYYLLFMIMSLALTVSAHDLAIENNDGVTIYYNFINDGKELSVTYRDYNASHSNEYQDNVVIPEEVTYENKTFKVTSIGERAFDECFALTSVTIGNSVTSIGNFAFAGCSGLTFVTIPNSVTSIGDSAFLGCSGLTSVTIGNSVTSIGKETFKYCSSLTSVTIGNSVTNIGDKAFYFCYKLTSVTIPNSVTSIGEWAFYSCYDLNSITIGNSVTSIGRSAFDKCTGLTSVTISDIAAWCKINFYGGTSNPLLLAEHLFLNGSEVKDLVIPNSVTSIGYEAFLGCRGLTSITIPNSVTSIGKRAFDLCSHLITVISLIEEPFAIWGKIDVFAQTFSDLTFDKATLYVPNGTIAKYKATGGWQDFLFIKEKDQGEEPDDDGEENADSKITIHIATAGTLSDIIPDNEKYQIEELTLTGEINSDDLGFLREMAGKERKNAGTKMSFNDTEGKLVSLDISKAKIVVGGISIEADDMDNFFEFAVTRDNEIPPRLFQDCKNLTNISISDDVYSIGSQAFHGTKWYDNQPDGLVYLGNMLYSYKGDMPKNTDVTIKDGTIGIACSAFSSCKNLVSVKIPNSIINIGGFNKYPNVGFDGAFEWCTGLKTVISEIQNPPVFEYSTFRTIDDTIYSNATLYVPTGTIDLYKSTEGWNNFTNIVDSDPSGINNVLLNEKKDAPAYNLNGRRLIQPQKGINIIEGKKVLIK